MNAKTQAALAFIGGLSGALMTAWMGNTEAGEPIRQFSDVNPVQYGIAVLTGVMASITQFKTAKSNAKD